MTGDDSTQVNHSLSLSCGVDCPLIANNDWTCKTQFLQYYVRIPSPLAEKWREGVLFPPTAWCANQLGRTRGVGVWGHAPQKRLVILLPECPHETKGIQVSKTFSKNV